MPDTPTDVLVAAHQDIDTATRDFDTLMESVRAKQVEIEGAILITHDAGVRSASSNTGTTGAARGWAGAPARAWWSGCWPRRCSARLWSVRPREG
jgi:hypothetical protein